MSPSVKIFQYVESYLTKNNLDVNIVTEVPKKWEKYGDFVLFNDRSFSNSVWKDLDLDFWFGICEILKCKRIGIKGRIQTDQFRTPNVRLVMSNDPWVECIDNKIHYSWNVLTNMFCAGNAPERNRIGKLDCRGKVVVDLYAGIGYFTLPYLVHSKAAKVHACEWNPHAVAALTRNLHLNKVSDRCVVYEGDNRTSCPVAVADYVNLGLLPSSESSWQTACRALKPQGGTLLVHGNVESKKTNKCLECEKLLENSAELVNENIVLETGGSLSHKLGAIKWRKVAWVVWSVHVLHTMLGFLETRDRRNCRVKWQCTVEGVHFVKSYAPHVDHLVVDVVAKPVS